MVLYPENSANRKTEVLGYDTPRLKKYGSMKQLTQNTIGSGADNTGQAGSNNLNVSGLNGDPQASLQNDTLFD